MICLVLKQMRIQERPRGAQKSPTPTCHGSYPRLSCQLPYLCIQDRHWRPLSEANVSRACSLRVRALDLNVRLGLMVSVGPNDLFQSLILTLAHLLSL